MDKEKLTVIEICSGIGCQARGIENSPCFEPEVVATSEIDINAIICYAAIHCGMTQEMVDSYDYPSEDEMREYLTRLNIGYVPEKDKQYNWYKSGKKALANLKKTWLACKLSRNFGDVSRIESLPQADIWFWSTPCTDISIAGKLAGLNPDDNTRSSLIWQTLRLLKVAKENGTLPKFMILENVKNLVGKKFIDDFERLNSLISENFGYNVRWKVLNAKDCGIPQNRERVFAVYIRSDIDTGKFEFPEPFDLGVRLKDVLLEDVDKSYYIKTEKSEALLHDLIDTGRLDVAKYVADCQ